MKKKIPAGMLVDRLKLGVIHNNSAQPLDFRNFWHGKRQFQLKPQEWNMLSQQQTWKESSGLPLQNTYRQEDIEVGLLESKRTGLNARSGLLPAHQIPAMRLVGVDLSPVGVAHERMIQPALLTINWTLE